MAKAPLEFPGTLTELGGLSNAELVQLVKQVPSDHPQAKSLAHFMSKTDKLDYLAHHQYGVGNDVSHVIPAAEKKYADFLAKAKAKNEAAKVATGTNCSATAQKELESVAMQVAEQSLPTLTVFQGDVEKFMLDNPNLLVADIDTAGPLTGFINQIKGLDVVTKSEEEIQNALVEGLKVAKAAVEDIPFADVKTLLSDAKKLDEAAPVFGGSPIGDSMKILSAQAKQKAEFHSANYFLDVVPEWGNGQLASEMLTPELHAALEGLTKLDAAQMSANVASEAEAFTKQVTDALISQLDKTTPEYAELIAQTASQGSGAAFKELETAAKEASQSMAWAAHVPEFEKLTNVELKQMAYNEFEAHGMQKSLGSFLTKEQKVELLAKFKAGAPVDDLAAAAKEKYLAKEAASKGKKVEDVVLSPSVKAPEVKAAEAVFDAKAPEFDALKAVEATGEEHLAPPEPVIKFETEPHPEPKVSHVFTPTGERPSGGSHPMEWFKDENGDRWLFKVQPAWQSNVEALAADVGERLGIEVAEMRVETDVTTSFYGKVDGSFQRAMANTGELGKEGGALGRLTEEQVKELQRNQVYDWLISNHDSHGENFLLGTDGHLIPIDKGQAFKFFGNDLLSPTYSPNASDPVYNKLWADVIRGGRTVDLNAIDEMLTRVEQMDSKQFADMVRSGLEQKYQVGGRKISAYLPPEMRDLDAMVKAAVERKENIRVEFERFYKEIAQRAGIDWKPVWAEDVAKAEKIVEPAAKLAAQGDVATPITKELATQIAETNSAGKAVHLAGEEVNQGQALFWQETDVDGSKILRMEVRLESQADARVTDVFQDAAGIDAAAASSSSAASAGVAVDSDYAAIQDAAKTVNHHVTTGDFEPNQAKIDAMLKVNEGLFKAIDAADAADAKLAHGEIDVTEWAKFKAEGDKATAYKQVINDIQDGISFQHKVDHVQKFDIEVSKTQWLAKAPSAPDVPKPVVSEPPKLFETKPKLVAETTPSTQSGPGYMERVRDGGKRDIGVSPSYAAPGDVSMSYGKMFDGTMKVQGDEVRTTWSSWKMTSHYGGKSKLTMELKGWDGTEAGITKMLEAMQRLGVDSHLATVEEEKLTYWQVVTGQMKQSVEYANPSRASGPYIGIRNTIDTIESRIAKEAMDTKAKIDVYREEMAKQFGQDAVDRAPEAISHVHDLHGNEVGVGHFERFDLPQDLRPYLEKSGKQWGIARKGNPAGSVFEDGWGTYGNTDKLRIGAEPAGASAPADLASGGGTGSFSSLGQTNWQGSGPVTIVNPSSIMRRASTFAADHDNYGRIFQRDSEMYLNPSEWTRYIGTGISDSTREVVARAGYSFHDDLELQFVRSQTEKDALVKTFHDLGVDELRGVKIEDRIVINSAGDNRGIPQITDRWFRDHPEAYQHSYSNPVDLKGGSRAAASSSTGAPVLANANAPGSLEAKAQAYNNSLSNFHQTTNSVKAKLTDLTQQLKAAGVKTNLAEQQAAFDQWWQNVGSGSGKSQVKSVQNYLLHQVNLTTVQAKVAPFEKAADKLTALMQEANTIGKQQVLGDIFGKPWKELVQDFKDSGQGKFSTDPKFWQYLQGEAQKIDTASAVSDVKSALGVADVAKGGFEIPGIGEVPTSLLEQVVAGDTITEKFGMIANHLGMSDYMDLQAPLMDLAKSFGIDTSQAGTFTKTFEKMLEKAKAGATVEKDVLAAQGYVTLPVLGDATQPVLEKLAELTKLPGDIHVAQVADAIGLQEGTTQAVLQVAAKEYGVDGEGWQAVVKEWVHDAEQAGFKAAKTSEEFGLTTVPGFGTLTPAQAETMASLQSTVTTMNVPQLAGQLGMDGKELLKAAQDAALQYFPGDSASHTLDKVVGKWIEQSKEAAAGVKEEAAAEKALAEAEPHPGFTMVTPGVIDTPVGTIVQDGINGFHDAAYAIEHLGDSVPLAVEGNIGIFTQANSYGELLPKLDKYATEKGLGGFPGLNPAKVLDEFAKDAGAALSKGMSELSKPAAQAVEEVLSPTALTTAEDVGKFVAPPDPAEKVFAYSMPGGKVNVVFQKVGTSGSNVLVENKYTGKWQLLKPTGKGKTPKDEIQLLLGQINHPAAEPF